MIVSLKVHSRSSNSKRRKPVIYTHIAILTSSRTFESELESIVNNNWIFCVAWNIYASNLALRYIHRSYT